MRTLLRTSAKRILSPLVRLHRDERGDALEYLLVLGAFAIPMVALMSVLRNILADYYSMIAFFVGWPFL